MPETDDAVSGGVATTADPTTTDVLVIGSGIAGCAAALSAAREGQNVIVATKAERPEDATSWWAQGGVAVSRADPEGFKNDILTASDGAADPDAVDVLVENANSAVEDVLIETLDVPFDTAVESGEERGSDSNSLEFDYGREAAHGDRRILHVNASTGRYVLGPFLSHLDDHPNVEIRDDTVALDLLTHEGRVHGALLDSADTDADGTNVANTDEAALEAVYAGATVLATGGIGTLYERSTNPEGATGDGVAMAALAGADVTDMEYVQFHPTAYAGDESEAQRASKRSGEAAKSFLLSEAIRGEGALLRNGDGERFMPEYHPDAELAPRDVVARAVADERERTGDVRLDVSPLAFEEEFPDLAGKCAERGVEFETGIPVAPAEHFLCGGIEVDSRGRTSLDRLFAVGECSRTGVHGANRLASTSLLEGLVWGLRAGQTASADEFEPEVIEAPDLRDSDPALPDGFAREKFGRLQKTMDEFVGLERTPEGLSRASAGLRRLKGEVDAYVRTRTSRSLYELRSACVVALLITRAASRNHESRGCHYLVDEDDATEPASGNDEQGTDVATESEPEAHASR